MIPKVELRGKYAQLGNMHNSFVVVGSVVQEAESVTGETSLWENMRKKDFFYVMYKKNRRLKLYDFSSVRHITVYVT